MQPAVPSNDCWSCWYVSSLNAVNILFGAPLAVKSVDIGCVHHLTFLCLPGPDNYKRLRLPEMTPYLDFYNLMAYDYSGSWDTTAGHQANLDSSKSNATSTPFSTVA